MSHGAQGGDGPDLASLAADPSTSHAELHQLAAERPDLRALIAENPHTYPQLVEWLRSLNDPDINAALSRRDNDATQHISTAAAESAPPSDSADQPQQTRALPTSGAPTAHTPPEPTQEFGAVRQPRSEPEPSPTPAASDFDQRVYGTQPAAAGPAYAGEYPQSPGYNPQPSYPQPPYGYHQQGYAPAAPIYDQPQEQPAPRRRGGGCAIVLLLALLTLAALAATYFLLFGNPLASDDDAAAPTEQQEDPAPEEEQPAEDQQSPGDAEDATPEGSPSPTQDEDDPDDDQQARPGPDDALNITAFSAPSDNIHCTLGEDDVTCTIDEYFFDAPSGCEEAVTVRVSRDGAAETACDESLSSQGESLDYGQSTGNDDFVCEATETYFECWSQQTGNGFQLAREYYTLYDY